MPVLEKANPEGFSLNNDGCITRRFVHLTVINSGGVVRLHCRTVSVVHHLEVCKFCLNFFHFRKNQPKFSYSYNTIPESLHRSF